jgi:predicted small metal-binding protein
MEKVIYCNKVDPSSDCREVIRGKTDEEVITRAKIHARQHGIREMTPDLLEKVKASIENG